MDRSLEQTLSSLPPSIHAQIHGRYTLLRTLGQGGMAVVLLARQEDLGREVAIKIQKHDGSAGELSKERAEFEAKALASLAHPNLIRLYEFWMEDDVTCLICEYVEGEDLSRFLDRCGALALPDSLVLVRPVLEGLEHLHERRIIHRDLKPANILLQANAPSGNGLVKLADFGLVLAPTRDFRTAAGTILGTMAYMSPEQIRGESAEARSDLYSLGIMLHVMFTGNHPYGWCTDMEMVSKHLKSTPASLPDSFPRWADTLVQSLLEKRPEDRPASARQVLDMVTERTGNDRDERTRALAKVVLSSCEEAVVTGPKVPPVRSGSRDRRPPPRSGAASARTRVHEPVPVPARGLHLGAAVGGLLLLVAMLAAGVFLRSRPTQIESLRIAIAPGRVSVHGIADRAGLQIGLPGLAPGWVEWSGPPGDLQGAIDLPAGGRAPESIRVAVRQGDESLVTFEVPLPARRPRFSPSALRFPGWKAGLEEGELRVSWPDEEVRASVPGRFTEEGAIFTIPPEISRWKGIRVDGITAKVKALPGEGSHAPLVAVIDLETGGSWLTRQGLDQLVKNIRKECTHLADRRGLPLKKMAEPREPRELFDQVFDPAKSRTGDAGYPGELASDFAAYFRDPAVPSGEKLETHEWLRRLGEIYVWVVEGGHPRFEPLEVLVGGGFPVRYGSVPADFRVDPIPQSRVFGLQVETSGSERRGTDVAYTVGGVEEDNLYPPEGRPPQLEKAQDLDKILSTQKLEPPPTDQSAGPLILRVNVWHHCREHGLRVAVKRPAGPVSIDLWNFADEGRVRRPRGTPALPRIPYSWKNIPVCTNQIDVQLPAGLFEVGEAPDVELQLLRSFGHEDRAFEFLCILGYEWIAAPVLSTKPQD